MWLFWLSVGLGFPILLASMMAFEGLVIFDGSTLAFYIFLLTVWAVSMGYTAGRERGRQEKAESADRLFQEKLETEDSDKSEQEK